MSSARLHLRELGFWITIDAANLATSASSKTALRLIAFRHRAIPGLVEASASYAAPANLIEPTNDDRANNRSLRGSATCSERQSPLPASASRRMRWRADAE